MKKEEYMGSIRLVLLQSAKYENKAKGREKQSETKGREKQPETLP